jgi:hypothetical protein
MREMDKAINLAPAIADTAGIAEHLEFDSFGTANALTGKSYKEDTETESLGVALHLASGNKKRAALTAADDTLLCNDLDNYIRIISEEGFAEVLRMPFDGKGVGEGCKETFYVFWHTAGLLLSFDTFGGERVNGGHIYFNWRSKTDSFWPRHGSGSGCKKDHSVFTGHIDCREALRFRLRELREGGEFLSPWIEQPFLWLLHYADTKAEGYNYGTINADRLALLPPEVRACVGA